MTTTIVEPVDAAALGELRAQVNTLENYALHLVVGSPASEQEASDTLNGIKRREKLIRATFGPNIARWNKGHKDACAEMGEFLAKLKPPNTLISDKVLAYRAKQEAIRRAEEQRLRRQAMKEAEDARLEEAARLEAEGRTEEAEQTIANPVAPVPVVLAPVPKAKGVATITTWKHRVINAALVPPEWKIIDEPGLAAYAKRMKELAVVPGVVFEPESSLSRTGRR